MRSFGACRKWSACRTLAIVALISGATLIATGYHNNARAWGFGDNGWGNGGEDGINKGSGQGQGVAQGGPGAGDSQAGSKSLDSGR